MYLSERVNTLSAVGTLELESQFVHNVKCVEKVHGFVVK